MFVQENAGRAMPAASTIKLPIAMLAALSPLQAGQHDPIKLPPTVYPSLTKILDLSRGVNGKDLIALTLSVSDNPCATALLQALTPPAVNRFIYELDCQETRVRAAFDDEALSSTNRNNTMSAADAIKLLAEVWRREDLRSVLEAMENGVYKERIGLRLPDDGVRLANKTGSLDGVVNDIGLIYSADVTLAVAFFCADGGDPILAATDIANTAARLWELVGGRTDDD